MNPARLLALCLAVLFASSAGAMEKWLYYPTNLLVDKNVDTLEGIWKRAAAAGYTHVLIADSKFSKLGDMEGMPQYFKNIERVKKIATELKLEIVPALFSIGYSNDILWHDPNLIEAMPVKDLPLVVKGGIAQIDDSEAPAVPEGGFTNLKKWGFHDESLSVDGHVLHVPASSGNSRIFLPIKVQPWRQYHVSVRVKTNDLKGEPEIKVMPEHGDGADLQWNHLGVKPTQDWTEIHAVFNSQKFTSVTLVFGMWGGSKGDLWWDEPKLEETAFVNLARREGAPLAIATADGKKLVEGTDFEKLTDPKLGSDPWKGEYDTFHTPPQLKTKLPDGTKLRASYYHGVTVYDHQATICLSEPKTYELLRDQAKRMHAAWSAHAYFMEHDEIRVMNWCAACEARHLTPGQLLADNVKKCSAILREVNPGGRIYVWNDMFDPNHNAVKGPYYLVNGPITGSWEGLDQDLIIVPWYFEKRAASFKFFADRGNKMVAAGFYDAKPLNAVDWLTAAKAVPNSVLGAMYTTWRNDYSEMEAFSKEMDKVK